MSEITPGRPLRLYKEDGSYTDVSTDTFVGEKMNFLENWVCGAGVENIYIDMDGQVFGASCRIGGKLGNIYENMQTPDNWVLCTKKICSCGADLFIPKYKEPFHQELLVRTLDKSSAARPTALSGPYVAMERTHDSSLKQVYWEIGRRCNFDCSYCWPHIHNKTDPHKSLTDLISATLLIEERFCKGQPAHFVISGGEPTLNPDFMHWTQFIFNLGHKISMHSNGSNRPEYYKQLIHFTNINISVHFEFSKPERLLKVIEAITAEKVAHDGLGHLEVKLMMQPGDREKALSFEQGLAHIPRFKGYCTHAIVPIRDNNNGDHVVDGYLEEDYQLFGDRSL
jgi:hypothetical protein